MGLHVHRKCLFFICGVTTLIMVYETTLLGNDFIRIQYRNSLLTKSQINPPEPAMVKFYSGSPCTSPQNHLVYVKTHKTGSTTLQQIIHLFGYYHNLSFLFNANDQARGHFRYQKIIPEKVSSFLPPINVSKGDYDRYRNYDMFAAHIQHDRQALTPFMREDAKYITIIREPANQFESAFGFFIKAGKYTEDTQINADIQTWLNDADLLLKTQNAYSVSTWLNNGQMVDLGMDPKYVRDHKRIEQMIDKLDREFNLVLLVEYFDQSLLLLRKLMCWDMKDILYLKQNVRYKHSQLSSKTRMRIKNWNMADAMLYEHFKANLFRKIHEYGPEFHIDLLKFKRKLSFLNETCITRDIIREEEKNTIVHITKKNASDYCFLISYSRNVFQRLWERQDPESVNITRNFLNNTKS